MNAIQFPESNKVFVAPPGLENQVIPLPVYADEVDGKPVIISCWEPT